MRRFNRFYTQQIGVLQKSLLNSEYSLTEVRVLYELNDRKVATAADLVRDLGLDAGYLSRLLRKLEKAGLIERRTSAADARQSEICLTAKGSKEFAELDARSQNQVIELLSDLSGPERSDLLRSMARIERLLGKPAAATPYVIRQPEAGDLGWIVHRHGSLYASEYDWNVEFEGMVAGVVSDFVRKFDPARDRCWIAENESEILGSAFVVHSEGGAAQLRLLYVEPEARRQGVGSRLLKECIRFADRAGYESIFLWTNDILTSARRLYETAGFQLSSSEQHERFGPHLEGQIWKLALAGRNKAS